MIGKTILHYKILSKLGEGGMGVVYKAEDTKLERTVAIKLLPAHLLASADDRARFHREAKAAAALNHSNIATVYEINEFEDKPFIAMEYVEGKTLNDALEEELFKLKDAVSITIQVAEGLKAAHGKDIIHRDIKSGNVLLSSEGQAKILDFGLAKTAMSTKLTKMGSTLGTVAYMSPEQVSTQTVDQRTDLWALGVVLFEMLTGRLPFSGEYDQAIFYNILNEPPEPLTAIRSGIPMSLEWIVNKLLAKNPDERYQNANDLIIDLKAIDLQTSGFSRVNAVSSQSKVMKPQRVKKTIPLNWGIILLGLLLILTIAYLMTPGKSGLSLSDYKYTPFETEGIVYSGRWSPDGKSIAYVKAVNGDLQLRIRSLGNPRSTLLTTVNYGRDLFWSPDGNTLYFLVDEKLQTIGLTGGDPKVVLQNRLWSAAISPDKEKLLFWNWASRVDSTFGDSATVFISNTDGTQIRRYLPDPFKIAENYAPVNMKFSPDGLQIALTMFVKDGVVFWILPWPDGEGAKPNKIFENKKFTQPPYFEWLPDSRRIVLSNAGGLWIGDTEDETLVRITSSQQGEYLNSVSPDGKRILFGIDNSNYDVVMLPFDGSPLKPVIATSLNENSATVSSDGKLMTYITQRSGRAEIWLEEQNGSGRPIVTEADFQADSSGLRVAVISPDGKRVAYNRAGEKSYSQLWVSNSEGGKPVLMLPDSLVVQNPCWAPDGQSLYCSIYDGDTSYSVILPIGSGETVHLPDSAWTMGLPTWSPDGKWIALKQEEKIRLISPDGKKMKTLIPPVDPSGWEYCMAWSRDSKKIYVGSSVDKVSRLDVIDAETGNSRKIAEYGSDVWFGQGSSQSSTASISQDGKGLIVTATRRSGSLHILDGALR